MKTTTYKGIELNGLDKNTKLSHSRFLESNENTNWLETLITSDKTTLTPGQFYEVSALNSVINMDYQICNGGLVQYFQNYADKEREPFNEQDVAHLDKEKQEKMLATLIEFGKAVFPEREADSQKLEAIAADFANAYYEEPSWGYDWDEDEDDYDDEDGLYAPYDFDNRFYQVNEYLEQLLEAYAQYLAKSYARQ